eukprot:1146844-Pelagomonas_calceolata.AAC.3
MPRNIHGLAQHCPHSAVRPSAKVNMAHSLLPWKLAVEKSSSPCLISVMRDERIPLKSTSGASKFISTLDTMDMKLQDKLGGKKVRYTLAEESLPA